MNDSTKAVLTALLGGSVVGGGTAALLSAIRDFRETRKSLRPESTDKDTIVLSLPKKLASAYDCVKDMQSGTYSVTANNGKQLRDRGRFSSSIAKGGKCVTAGSCTKKASDGNDREVLDTAGRVLAVLGGGILGYGGVSRLCDAYYMKRLKRRLEAAQTAYVGALAGGTKNAAAVDSALSAVSDEVSRATGSVKQAWSVSGLFENLPSFLPQGGKDALAAYLLLTLGASASAAYLTKKTVDKAFPEKKIKKDINKPTKIVFRTVGETKSDPRLIDASSVEEKDAECDVGAVVMASMPIYKDVVEGAPNRVLGDRYVKLAEAMGTDPVGLMKLAEDDFCKLYAEMSNHPSELSDVLISHVKSAAMDEGLLLDEDALKERLRQITNDHSSKSRVTVVGGDPDASAFVKRHARKIRKVLRRLNAQGDI